METRILEIATQIGTPLALAGLSIAVLFLIYRALISSQLLSTVTASHSFRVINRMLTFLLRLRW
jgi:hypothetical protein